MRRWADFYFGRPFPPPPPLRLETLGGTWWPFKRKPKADVVTLPVLARGWLHPHSGASFQVCVLSPMDHDGKVIVLTDDGQLWRISGEIVDTRQSGSTQVAVCGGCEPDAPRRGVPPPPPNTPSVKGGT